MKDIEYSIQIHNYWHCGSGLAAGADVDALVIRTHEGLPYIPGKTVKGLVREAVDTLLALRNVTEAPTGYAEVFGYFDDKDDKQKASAFFHDAVLNSSDAEAIKDAHLEKFLFTSVASTAINEEGVAKDHSLRRTEVALPCTLEGKILDVHESMVPLLIEAFGMIKNLGLDRNRGLGRCTWKEIKA